MTEEATAEAEAQPARGPLGSEAPKMGGSVRQPLPSVQVAYPHVVVDPSVEDGSPTIEGSKVSVHRLFAWHRQGTTVETLVRRYPGLGMAKILTALAFAYDNMALVTADIIREREEVAREQAR